MSKIILNLDDSYKAHDSASPRGIVSLKDSNGKLVFKKENMIVKSGRKHIAKTLFRGGSAGNQYILKLGDGADIVTADDVDLSSPVAHANDVGYPLITGNINEDNEPYFEFTVNIFGTGVRKITRKVLNEKTGLEEDKDIMLKDIPNCYIAQTHRYYELGLFIPKEGAGGEMLPDTMFSHLVFPPVTIGPNDHYELTYKIYF